MKSTIVAILLSSLVALVVGRVYFGGPGNAVYFRAPNLDIIGNQWNNQDITNSNEFTVEFWLYIVDTNQAESLTFSYAANHDHRLYLAFLSSFY